MPKDVWEARMMLMQYLGDHRLVKNMTTLFVEGEVKMAKYAVPETFIPLSRWDVSALASLKELFYYCDSEALWNDPANDITHWDVSHVTDMSYMFAVNYYFNQPIGSWNVSRVTKMQGMFSYTRFNQPIGAWDVSRVTDMSSMFSSALGFNQPIGTWNVSSVSMMSYMFKYAYRFNQSLDEWDVQNVHDLSYMFHEAYSFDQPLNRWNVSNVTDMSSLFNGAKAFNQPLSTWNVAKVLTMRSMFERAYAFNQSLSSWNMMNVRDIQSMFGNCKTLTKLPYAWANYNRDTHAVEDTDAKGRPCFLADRITAAEVFWDSPVFIQLRVDHKTISLYDFLHVHRPDYYAMTFLHTRRNQHSQAPAHRARTAALSNAGIFEHIMTNLSIDPEDVAHYASMQHARDVSNVRVLASKKRRPASRHKSTPKRKKP